MNPLLRTLAQKIHPAYFDGAPTFVDVSAVSTPITPPATESFEKVQSGGVVGVLKYPLLSMSAGEVYPFECFGVVGSVNPDSILAVIQRRRLYAENLTFVNGATPELLSRMGAPPISWAFIDVNLKNGKYFHMGVTTYVDSGVLTATYRHSDDPRDTYSCARLAISMVDAAVRHLNAEGGEVYRLTPNPKNQSRLRQGKRPLFDWTTVTISPRKPERSEPKGGTHASPRRHQRRGHYRTYKSGKRVWVNEMWVGSASNGTVFHDYKVTA